MKDSQKRTCYNISLNHQDEFHDFCRNGDSSSFIRNRKMPLSDLLFTMINRRGITLSLELRNYMKTAHPGMEISKPGYLKQRMKLNPLAFYELYRHHNRNFYAEPRFFTFHGYLVLKVADAELHEKEKNRKHKMAVNRTLSIGILKNDLIYILLETDAIKHDMLFQQIYEDISRNLVPVRPDRHYHRTKGQLAGKYSNTHKRAY